MIRQAGRGRRRSLNGRAGGADSCDFRAVLLLLAAVTLAPLGDALSKQLALTMTPLAIVFLRYFCGGCLALPVAWLRGERLWPARGEWPGLILSTALVMGAMALLVAGLARAPLADVAGAFMTAPLVAMLLTAAVRRRVPALRQALGAVLGLVGAGLILHPRGGGGAGVLLGLAAGVLLGGFLAFNALQAARGRAGGAGAGYLARQCLLGAAMLLPLAGPSLRWPAPAEWLQVAALGAITVAAHGLTVAAYRRADPALLAPFFPFNLVVALILGRVLFGELPDPPALAGLGLIVAGALLAPGRGAGGTGAGLGRKPAAGPPLMTS